MEERKSVRENMCACIRVCAIIEHALIEDFMEITTFIN